MLFLHSLAHLLVDALCAATVFGRLGGAADLTGLILLYNTLAFSTQCLVGLAADRIGKHVPAASASMALVVLGYALPVPAAVRVVLIGTGNRVFHVAAGTVTLAESGGKAGKLGVFVAPGAIGVTLGTLFSSLGWVFAVLLALAALAEIPLAHFLTAASAERPRTGVGKPAPAHTDGRFSLSAVLLLTAAVAVRAVGGSVVRFPWKTGAAAALILTAAVWLGKTAGGFLCDRLGADRRGAKRAAWISVPAAAALITFCSAWMIPSLAGQFFINLTMPVTLWLLYRAMPDAPGFAFGLAASALWPGTIAGKLITLTGPAAALLTLASFFFGLFAILYAANRILPKSENDPTSERSPIK